MSKQSQSLPLWGSDLGGTKIEGALLDPANPTQAPFRLRVPTESSKGYDHAVHQISLLIEQLEMASELKCPAQLGIGTPVATPQSGLLKNSNILCLNGKPLARDLSARLGCEVFLANDANRCALAEAPLGAAMLTSA